MIDNNRLKHSYAVGKKMMEIGKQYKLSDFELQKLFVLGLNHDIGYEFGNNLNHNIVGGKLLKENDYKYWQEVYYHGQPECKYKSLYLDILNIADMQIDKYGNDVGYDRRLEDVKIRYGEKSDTYLNCFKLIDKLNKILQKY